MSHESIEERVCLWEDKGSATVWAKPRFFVGGSGATTAPSIEFVIVLTREGKCLCGELDQYCRAGTPFHWSQPSCEGEGEGDAAVGEVAEILKRSRSEGSCAPDEIENQNNCFGSLPPRKFYKRFIYELSEDDMRSILSRFGNNEEHDQGMQACVERNTQEDARGANVTNWPEAFRCAMNQCQRRQGSQTLDCEEHAEHNPGSILAIVGSCGVSTEAVMRHVVWLNSLLDEPLCDMLKYPYRLDCDGGRSSAYVISDSEIDAANRKVLEELDPSFRFQIESYTLL